MRWMPADTYLWYPVHPGVWLLKCDWIQKTSELVTRSYYVEAIAIRLEAITTIVTRSY